MDFIEFPVNPINKKTSDWSDSKVLKVSLFIVLVIASIILLPVAVLAYPFIFAWENTKTITSNMSKKNKKMQPFGDFDPSRWEAVSLDFSNWLKSEDNNG